MTPPPPKPKPARGMPRSLIYALIPGGFLLIILILMFTGFWTQDVTHDGPGTMDQPPAATQGQPPAQAQDPVQGTDPAGQAPADQDAPALPGAQLPPP